MEYPNHLNEKIRKEIAIFYLQHEFKKLFLKMTEEEYKKIDKNIADWVKSPELCVPRDFWNGFHGISMGFKLKIGLVYLVTAENIIWKKKKVKIDNLFFGTELGTTTNIENKPELSAKIISKFYKENLKIKNKKLKEIIKIRSNTIFRDNDPILIVQKKQNDKDIFSVYDGNGRLARAILEGKKTILGYVGTYKTEEKIPKNYWVPTSVLMDILFHLYKAIDDKNEKIIDSYIEVIRDMVKDSESGKYELMNRSITGREPYRTIILKKLK